MAALVQSFPQQSSTVTMLQTRPSSASGILQTSSQTPRHQYPANPAHRQSFHGINNAMGISNYRGHTAIAPIAPYAFTSTPSLATPVQRIQGPHLRSDRRTSSAPTVASAQQGPGDTGSRSRYPAPASVSTSSSSSSFELSSVSQTSGSRDDSGIAGIPRISSGNLRPHSTIITSSTLPNLAPAISSPVKTAPDRYRRPNNRRADSLPSGQQLNAPPSLGLSALPNVMQFYGSSTKQATSPMASFQGSNFPSLQFSGSVESLPLTASGAVDDMHLNRNFIQDQAKRYRRRSIHTIDARDYNAAEDPTTAGLLVQGSRQVSSANGRIDYQQHPLRSFPIGTGPPASPQGRNGSTESIRSTPSSSRPSSVSKPLKINVFTACNADYPSPIKRAFDVHLANMLL